MPPLRSTLQSRVHLIYSAVAAIILVAAVGYGVMQYRLLANEKLAIAQNETFIENLSAELKETIAAQMLFAEEQSTRQLAFNKNFASVLPPNENYTDLTRLFDTFFAEHDTTAHPIVQSSLRFGKSAPVNGMSNISALPISMNIEGTRENFFKFLDFVEQSGSFETGMRLMTINSINLNFPEGGEVLDNAKQIMNFTVEMSAFFETPKVKNERK